MIVLLCYVIGSLVNILMNSCVLCSYWKSDDTNVTILNLGKS